MNQDYIKPDNWSIIEEGFDPKRIKSSESLFSLGNGAMGQRANFEEKYSGETFQGSYIGGVYYPDKTKVGWWKNGYPEYFAKVLNAPNWIGINVQINGEELNLSTCIVSNFRRELSMKTGVYTRSFHAKLNNSIEVAVNVTRFLSLDFDEVGYIKYEVTPLNSNAEITFNPYIDAGVQNEDANWDEKFWEMLSIEHRDHSAFVTARTFKTHFVATTFMHNSIWLNDKKKVVESENLQESADKIGFDYKISVKKGQKVAIQKIGGYTVSLNHDEHELVKVAIKVISKICMLGFESMLERQWDSWDKIWEMSDITIIGDVKAQQGIRFNIFQLNQTYLGKDSRLNIGPKGFTGEKYGGSTYWDTEAYCLPFYLATKDQQVARNLLEYRFNHLQKAIENAEKLGFTNGAALYPMVTMNGEECHNEWEITFEEIHRNGAIAFAIFNYHRYTGDYSYTVEKGLEVLIAISRFWHQRATYSVDKDQFVILGVTGPNEYENNVNNNFYTNYIARWCIEYTFKQLKNIETAYPRDYERIIKLTNLTTPELTQWDFVKANMYLPYSEKHQVYLQQDGFLDKLFTPVSDLLDSDRPINQKWSWDRILRSPFIKQADVLQCFYFFEDHFTKDELERHFDYYEPLTVHESSLSPCVHSIQAAALDKMDLAYKFYLRTSRLDLDDYNNEVEEGCHITSMAGTWMSIVEGFGGMRIKNHELLFNPKIPKEWESYSFKINFRNQILKVSVEPDDVKFVLEGTKTISVMLNGVKTIISPEGLKYL